jgi:hypothetical protein
MPAPLAFSNDELNILNGLAAPLQAADRGPFMRAVAEALHGTRGEGAVHQAARHVQRQFFTPPQLSDIQKGGRQRLSLTDAGRPTAAR